MRYSLRLTNRNGYTISKEFRSISSAKDYAKFYPLSVFFGWIYDKENDEMVAQNLYSEKWKRCNNETFIPYYM